MIGVSTYIWVLFHTFIPFIYFHIGNRDSLQAVSFSLCRRLEINKSNDLRWVYIEKEVKYAEEERFK